MLSGFSATVLDGCFMMRCEDTVHGVKNGDRFETTIIGRHEAQSSSNTCGDLGDLGEGTTLRWTARPDGPGDGCDDHLDVEVESVSSGDVSGSELRLPNGCVGNWFISVHALSGDSDLKTVADPENPTFYIQRSFTATGPVNCFGEGSTLASCSDAFVAESKSR